MKRMYFDFNLLSHAFDGLLGCFCYFDFIVSLALDYHPLELYGTV